MPGMNGIDLIRVLKSDHDLSSIPIVAMTASTATVPPGVILMKKPFSAEVAVGLLDMYGVSTRGRDGATSSGKTTRARQQSGIGEIGQTQGIGQAAQSARRVRSDG
jgi:hypothetical protein